MSHNFVQPSFFNSFFGYGVDGDVTVLNGQTLTLTFDRYYKKLTVNSGGTVNTAGYKLFVSEVLNIESGGVIQYNAPHSVGRVASSGYGFQGTVAGYPTWGAMGVSGSEGGVVNHPGLPGNSLAAQMRGPGVPATSNTGRSGGKGGNATLAGGNGGAGTIIGTAWGSMRTYPQCITFKPMGFASAASFSSGPGGGGGACDAGGTNDWSGAGGSGGAAVGIIAYELRNYGSIECKGGNGGNASGAVKAGGGAGGCGGSILITTRIITNLGTLNVSGGTGGTGVNGGESGSSGESGYTQVVII
jgi:hypothetical protein